MTNQGTKPLRGAVVGYGYILSKGHIPAYFERAQNQGDVEIVAVADVCAERRDRAAEKLPEARIYTSADILLEQEADGLDFIDIATPPCYHAQIAANALRRGLHVLCEKPLTTSLADARMLLDTALETRRVIFPCHNYKHAPVVKAIREVIDSGKIGRVRSLTLNTFRNTHAKGVTEWRTNWRRENRYSGGGIAMDHGSHTFYLTFDWLGSYPTKVTAKMANLEPDKWDTEDSFSATLTFPNGLANVHLTWTAGVRKVIYTVQGERGAITVDDDDMQVAVMQKTSGEDVAQGAVEWEVERRTISSDWMDASHVQWFNSMFDQFRETIIRGEVVGREAREAYLCMQLIETAYRSASQGSQELPLSSFIPGS